MKVCDINGNHVECIRLTTGGAWLVMELDDLDDDFPFSDTDSESGPSRSCPGNKQFSMEVVDVLEALYRRGMTGWGKKHSQDLDTAIASTGLHLTQVKVYCVVVIPLY